MRLEQALGPAPWRRAPPEQEREARQRECPEHEPPRGELHPGGMARPRPVAGAERRELSDPGGDRSREPERHEQVGPHRKQGPDDHHADRDAHQAPAYRGSADEASVVHRDEQRDRERGQVVEPSEGRAERSVEAEAPDPIGRDARSEHDQLGALRTHLCRAPRDPDRGEQERETRDRVRRLAQEAVADRFAVADPDGHRRERGRHPEWRAGTRVIAWPRSSGGKQAAPRRPPRPA